MTTEAIEYQTAANLKIWLQFLCLYDFQPHHPWMTLRKFVFSSNCGYPLDFQRLVLYPVSTRRCFDVYTTSITLKRRRMDVKTTSCAYWVGTLAYLAYLCIRTRILKKLQYRCFKRKLESLIYERKSRV